MGSGIFISYRRADACGHAGRLFDRDALFYDRDGVDRLIPDEGRAAPGCERSVAATPSLAFDKLGPATRQLLSPLAFAAPEPLPERFFRETAAVLPPQFAASAANPRVRNRGSAELRACGLAERILDQDHPDAAAMRQVLEQMRQALSETGVTATGDGS